jgi:alpha-tubulin suppressor-like RCC1 family protein
MKLTFAKLALYCLLCLISEGCGFSFNVMHGLDGNNSALIPASSQTFFLSGNGYNMCVAISGAAYCCGANTYGEIGDGTNNDALIPTAVFGLSTGVTKVTPGKLNSCAIVDGSAQCWGAAGGYLGDGTNNQSLVPVQVQGLTSGVTDISAGTYNSCAVVSGAAYCWGNNNAGQLGNNTTSSSASPVQVQGLASGVTAIGTDKGGSFGSSHTCAIVRGGVWCWGDNTYGELGNNSTTSSLIPVPVTGLSTGVSQISVGANHNCALVNGAVYCWGLNDQGQVGDSGVLYSSTPYLVPFQIPSLSSGVTQIAVSSSFSSAIQNGRLWIWGSDAYGMIGDGVANSGNSTSTPVQAPGLSSGATATAASSSTECAIVDGVAQCWGFNALGCMGINSSSYGGPYTVTSVVNWP